MKKFFKDSSRLILLFLLIASTPVLAHQPRITEQAITSVIDPEVSKAYYAQLTGEPQTYVINATESFNLYVNILVPDILGQMKDVTVTIFKNGDTTHPMATLGGSSPEWKYFFEPFGYDAYWQWSEYKSKVGSWIYSIRVSSPYNNSKYSLAVGEIENFDFHEIINTLSLIPKIKRDFFNESPMNFIFSPIGSWTIIILYICSFVFGIFFRLSLKKIPHQMFWIKTRNIGKPDRWIRFSLSVLLLFIAISTSWSLVLIFASGFCLFEAVFGWCPFYMLLGKDTCPTSD